MSSLFAPPFLVKANRKLFFGLIPSRGLISRTAGTIYGSTETTFYVLAVYFGSVGIKKSRYALLAG